MPNCNNITKRRHKTIHHFLLECPKYYQLRHSLINQVQNIANNNNIPIDVKLLLTGNGPFSNSQQLQIIKYTLQYVILSLRMV